MPHYRLYCFKDNTHIARAVDLDRENDDALNTLVAEHADGRAREVWRGGERVKKYPGNAAAMSQRSSGRT